MVYKKIIDEKSKHQFAFYFSELVKIDLNLEIIDIDNKELLHRLIKIVRLKINDQFILFDRDNYILCELLYSSKKNINVKILSKSKNKQSESEIIYLLPVLKKDNLQQAVYSLAEIGVSEIQLIETEKSRKSFPEKEFDRLQKAVIGAAEQSKNYSFPVLKNSEKFESILSLLDKSSDKILFDVDGQSFFDLRKDLKSKKKYLLVGPEGGLTDNEIGRARGAGFIVASLTETVLRAVQAVAISSALFRLK